MVKTSGRSHKREGKGVIKRLRYLKAISLALAMRWVLKTTRTWSSDDRCFGKACWDTLMLRSLMESRMTFIIHHVLVILITEKHSKRTFSTIDSIHALKPGCMFKLSLMKYATNDHGKLAAERILLTSWSVLNEDNLARWQISNVARPICDISRQTASVSVYDLR